MKPHAIEECCELPVYHRLNELASGKQAVVRHIETGETIMQRLMAMGLCAGREVKVVRQGNPLIVGLLGARIGVSRRVASQILVEPSHGGERR